MALVEKQIIISASPEKISDYASDSGNLSEWFVGVTSASVEGGFPEVGGSQIISYQAAGMNFEMTNTSTEYNYPNLLIMQMDGMMKGTFRWDYTDNGDGTTTVQATVDYKLGGGILGKIANSLVVEDMNAKQLAESLANLKAQVENL